MSCKYCKIKMRPIDEDMKVLKGENWKDEHGESGYIGQLYDDKFRMIVYYGARYACTAVDNIKYCPFCGAELTVPKEPYIKDEKEREIIKKWYNKNKIVGKLCSYGCESWLGLRGSDKDGNDWKIELRVRYISTLEYGKLYSLTELIGEEEE